MHVDTILPADQWREIAAITQHAEGAGFDGMLSAEIAHDPFIPLAFAALASQRLQLGTAIAVAFPRSPMILAHTSWDLQTQSNGRFVLGLGTQVKGHNERRFSVPWSAPVGRLREYIEALRAIWRTWQTGTKLDYQGQHYRFTLMTPEFAPPKNELPRIPITIAAVGPEMLKLAGRVCDGVRLHSFATRKYLEQVAIPQVLEGLQEAQRDRANFQIWGGGFIATGADEAGLQQAMNEVRHRLAFYGATRTYHGVLALHGWEELGTKLHEMSQQGRWSEMAAEVPDEMVRTFAACGTYAEIGKAVEARFGGLSDCIALGLPGSRDVGPIKEVIQDLQRIPTSFRGFRVSE